MFWLIHQLYCHGRNSYQRLRSSLVFGLHSVDFGKYYAHCRHYARTRFGIGHCLQNEAYCTIPRTLTVFFVAALAGCALFAHPVFAWTGFNDVWLETTSTSPGNFQGSHALNAGLLKDNSLTVEFLPVESSGGGTSGQIQFHFSQSAIDLCAGSGAVPVVRIGAADSAAYQVSQNSPTVGNWAILWSTWSDPTGFKTVYLDGFPDSFPTDPVPSLIRLYLECGTQSGSYMSLSAASYTYAFENVPGSGTYYSPDWTFADELMKNVSKYCNGQQDAEELGLQPWYPAATGTGATWTDTLTNYLFNVSATSQAQLQCDWIPIANKAPGCFLGFPAEILHTVSSTLAGTSTSTSSFQDIRDSISATGPIMLPINFGVATLPIPIYDDSVEAWVKSFPQSAGQTGDGIVWRCWWSICQVWIYLGFIEWCWKRAVNIVL